MKQCSWFLFCSQWKQHLPEMEVGRRTCKQGEKQNCRRVLSCCSESLFFYVWCVTNTSNNSSTSKNNDDDNNNNSNNNSNNINSNDMNDNSNTNNSNNSSNSSNSSNLLQRSVYFTDTGIGLPPVALTTPSPAL